MTDPIVGFDPKALADGYLRYAADLRKVRLADITDDYVETADERAYDVLNQLARDGPARPAWQAVLELVRRTPDAELDIVAVGPLEVLVRRHGWTLIVQIESESARDPRFQWALGCIWLDEDEEELPTEILDRIVVASGGRIKPMKRG